MLRNNSAIAIFSVSLLLFAGCGKGGTPSTTSTPTVPQASLASNITFPATTAGSTAAAQTVTLTNSGNGSLTITGTAIGGANPTDFAQSATTCAGTLAAAASCTISITFTPAAASTSYAATLTVTDNSGNVTGSTQSVTLSGSGAIPVTAPLATLSPTSLTFTATNTGSTSGPQTVTLSNTGTAALTGISLGAFTGTGAAAFSQSTTCTATLAVAASCPISVSFTPTATGPYAATLSVTDNATGAPQTVALSGTGVAPQAVLSATTITFPSTTVNTTSSSISVTLSNPGTATLTGISIGALTGTGAAAFAESPATTCGATLAVNATCTISATFSPTAAIGYAATISVASSATSTPQTISLSGTGASTSTITHTLYTFPYTFPETANPDASVSALYTLINSAKSTIDMTMYELQDTTFSGYLVAACKNGVKVRVILSSSEKSSNTPAYDQLNTAGANCSAVMSNTAFTNTHQKTITVDAALPTAQTAIMSLNLQTQYYTTTRDFALVENDPADIAAIEATFAQDYAAGTPYGGTQGASDFSYTPGGGDTTVYPAGDLIWSPTTAQADMLALINNAQSTLLIENEEMDATNIVSALVSACQRGVTVHVAMTNDDNEYGSEFTQLRTAGCGVNVYPDTATGFYVHAKAVVADYGLSTQQVYMGSINYSTASMTKNRELGMYITDQTIIDTLNTTMSADYAGGTPY